jgi:hypothetical protein
MADQVEKILRLKAIKTLLEFSRYERVSFLNW